MNLDRYELGDSIRRAFLKHGHDAWCSIADDVIRELSSNTQPESEVDYRQPHKFDLDKEVVGRNYRICKCGLSEDNAMHT